MISLPTSKILGRILKVFQKLVPRMRVLEIDGRRWKSTSLHFPAKLTRILATFLIRCEVPSAVRILNLVMRQRTGQFSINLLLSFPKILIFAPLSKRPFRCVLNILTNAYGRLSRPLVVNMAFSELTGGLFEFTEVWWTPVFESPPSRFLGYTWGILGWSRPLGRR